MNKLVALGALCFASIPYTICLDWNGTRDGSSVIIVKCCNVSEVFDMQTERCAPGSLDLALITVFLEPFKELAHSLSSIATRIVYISRPIHKRSCANSSIRILMPEVHVEDAFQVMADGTLFLPFYNLSLSGDFNEFCLEEVSSKVTGMTRLCVIICPPLEISGGHRSEGTEGSTVDCTVKFKIYPIFIGISILSLIFTLLIYVLNPELTNVPGQMVRNLAFSLIWSFSLLLVEHLLQSVPLLVCRSLSIAMYFFFVASFSWMTLISYDVTRTFRTMVPSTGHLVTEESRARYKWYRILAWGGPALASVVTLLMELVPLGHNMGWIQPKFGLISCWFAGDIAIVLYFYGPIGLLLLFNVILFVRVANQFSRLSQQTACGSKGSKLILRKHTSNSSQDQQLHLLRTRLWLGLKLLSIMGLSWIFEIISWSLSSSTPCWLWYFSDAVNLLQGFWIFLVFGAKSDQICGAWKRLTDH